MRIINLESKIIAAANKVHFTLGSGHLIETYVLCLVYELELQHLTVNHKNVFKICSINNYEKAVKADLLVENKIIIEIVNKTSEEDIFNLNTSILNSTKIKLGYIINFNSNLLSNGLYKFING